MKKIFFSFLLIFPIISWAQIAIKADIIYPVSAAPIRDGVILIQDGKIKMVGPAATLTIPPNYIVYTAKSVTPGLIDARTVIGMSGVLNIAADQDQLEKSSPIQPELRAIDAYNPEERLVKTARELGITTMHTGHGIGALVSGQTIIVKTKKGTTDQVTLNPFCMLANTAFGQRVFELKYIL